MFALRSSVRRLAVFCTRNLSSAITQFDPCSGCEIPCGKHPSFPLEILQEIDQGSMNNSVEKYHRHLCIAQSLPPSQWPKDVQDLPGGYLKRIQGMLNDKRDAIGYSVKLTAAFVDSKNISEQTTDWYLFPDQLKLSNVSSEYIEPVIERLFINNQSNIVKDREVLPTFNGGIRCERLDDVWVLICCHSQRDRRCGVAGSMLVDEIEKYVRETNQASAVHCLKVSHIGGHRFAGNVIVYPSGAWYGRVLTCHIPLLIDAYASSSIESKEKLQPLLRGYLDRSR